MKEKLLELAAAMERNEPGNNPGNWNLLLAVAERLDYSDQQNKDKDAEIQRLTRELKQAEDILEPQIKGAIAWQEEAEKLELEVERLTKEVEELRGENGELESKNIALEQAVDAFNYEIIKRDGIIKENARISELMSSDIQRLTKEVEECNEHKKQKEFFQNEAIKASFKVRDQNNELTRLRELLGKCQVILEENPVKFLKLLRDLDNALNHKP